MQGYREGCPGFRCAHSGLRASRGGVVRASIAPGELSGEDMQPNTIAAAALAFVFSAGAAAAQSAAPLKDRLVGAWDFVIAEVKAPDYATLQRGYGRPGLLTRASHVSRF